MLTYNGLQIRRLQYLWNGNNGEAVYLVETWAPRKTYHVPLGRIGADGGVDEVLRTAQFRGGQVLEDNRVIAA
jgi:hypothetical protein